MRPTRDLSLKDLIRAVSDELLASRAERIARSDQAIWEVSELTIEANFTVTDTAGGGGGFDLKVIKADAKVDHADQSVHKIILKMNALAKGDVLTDLGTELPVRPRESPD